MREAGGGGLWGAEYRGLTSGSGADHHPGRLRGAGRGDHHARGGPQPGRLHLYGLGVQSASPGCMIGIVAAGREADRRGLARPYIAGLSLVRRRIGRGRSRTFDGRPGDRTNVAGPRRRGGACGGLRCHRPQLSRSSPARMMAVLSTAWVVPGVVGPSVERRRSPPVRLALGVPGLAAAGRHHRGARPARAGRAGTAGQTTGERASPGGRGERGSGDRDW